MPAAIVESSNDAIISTNLDGIITTWNNAAEEIFGYRREEAVGLPVFILAGPGREDEMPVILDAIKRGESVQHCETAHRRKAGTAIDASLTVSPIRDESGWTFGASKIARDIEFYGCLPKSRIATPELAPQSHLAVIKFAH